MYYTDEENDKICINSQFEYDEAKRLNKQIIRIIIEIREKKTRQSSSKPQETASTETSSTRSSSNSSSQPSALAQNPLVQTLLFIQPFITNPQLLKAILPIFLSEINKNNIVSREDITKICLHANQILDYPFVQEFLTNKLPKIMHQIVGSQHTPKSITDPAPTPTSVQTNETGKQPEKAPTEQIYDMFNSFLSFAQNVASNVSLPNIPINPVSSSGSTTSESSKKSTETQASANNNNNSDVTNTYQPWLNTAKVETQSKPTPAPKEKTTPTIFLSELVQLRELGFPESNMLIELLNNANGDINVVIDQVTDYQ
jgi:hypothetical protein